MTMLSAFLMILNVAVVLDTNADLLRYRGSSDASAAVAVGDDHVIVADDENNVLRCYPVQGGPPVAQWNISEWVDAQGRYPEVDIEGATRVGDRIYWLSSHGRNKKGKLRANRYRLFATRVSGQGPEVALSLEGRACQTLAQQLVAAPSLSSLNLAKAAQLDEDEIASLAPKDKGLNIEGLAASADGKRLYLGFRNPRPQKKALIVPLENPNEVIEQGQAAVFGRPMLWDLGGYGIRSMDYVPVKKVFYVVAGSHQGTSGCRLYQWSGSPQDIPRPIQDWTLPGEDFNPEAMAVFPTRESLLFLSDDGTCLVKVEHKDECVPDGFKPGGWCENKALLDSQRKTFRGIWWTP